MRSLGLLPLFFCALCAQAAELPRLSALQSPQIDAAIQDAVRGKSKMSARIEAVSALFLGTPYVLGALGEGTYGQFDRDPLIRFDAVDCTTFVETVMALALADGLSQGAKMLNRIRYKNGNIRYVQRRHFTEADWIPGNIAEGFLRDVTRELSGGAARTARKLVKKEAWYARKTASDLSGLSESEKQAQLKRLQSLGRGLPDEEAELPYLPIENLAEALPRIPSGTIASLVREDQPDMPTMVSHQLFIIDGPDGKVVRHAAAKRGVEDVPALEYFQRYADSKWKLLGLNLVEVVAR
ncbi:MAG: N-acetylmuramoyl-L-alanine amidase-like domain-containing protein [Elusimicrobiota bacterium]|jgi:hypothetical protein